MIINVIKDVKLNEKIIKNNLIVNEIILKIKLKNLFLIKLGYNLIVFERNFHLWIIKVFKNEVLRIKLVEINWFLIRNRKIIKKW